MLEWLRGRPPSRVDGGARDRAVGACHHPYSGVACVSIRVAESRRAAVHGFPPSCIGLLYPRTLSALLCAVRGHTVRRGVRAGGAERNGLGGPGMQQQTNMRLGTRLRHLPLPEVRHFLGHGLK